MAAQLQKAGILQFITIGDEMRAADLASLYHAADVYISPYRAEGFNLPVLEAAVCDTPLIITSGGPIDDFTDPSFAVRIKGTLVRGQAGSDLLLKGDHIESDPKHLSRLILELAQ